MERGQRESSVSAPRVLTEVREPRTERLPIVITQRMRRRLTLALALTASLVLILAVAGCGSSSGGETTPPPDYAKALKGAPEPLAALYEEGNRLLPGGKDAFEKRVGELGYPVVANVWASWCAPCRYEFPMFQEASAKFGKRVAFLGVDAEDEKSEAVKWLKAHPVPYPSYFEVGAAFPASLKLTGRPDTVFYNPKGELVGKHIGQYANAAALEADIKKYALSGS
jgi:cytochrome c biogenesis protein CcmG, thiol:disulfide interchange protein DsbE